MRGALSLTVAGLLACYVAEAHNKQIKRPEPAPEITIHTVRYVISPQPVSIDEFVLQANQIYKKDPPICKFFWDDNF